MAACGWKSEPRDTSERADLCDRSGPTVEMAPTPDSPSRRRRCLSFSGRWASRAWSHRILLIGADSFSSRSRSRWRSFRFAHRGDVHDPRAASRGLKRATPQTGPLDLDGSVLMPGHSTAAGILSLSCRGLSSRGSPAGTLTCAQPRRWPRARSAGAITQAVAWPASRRSPPSCCRDRRSRRATPRAAVARTAARRA